MPQGDPKHHGVGGDHVDVKVLDKVLLNVHQVQWPQHGLHQHRGVQGHHGGQHVPLQPWVRLLALSFWKSGSPHIWTYHSSVNTLALQRHLWYTDLTLINSKRSNDLAILFLVSSTPYIHNIGLQ